MDGDNKDEKARENSMIFTFAPLTPVGSNVYEPKHSNFDVPDVVHEVSESNSSSFYAPLTLSPSAAPSGTDSVKIASPKRLQKLYRAKMTQYIV